MCDILVQWRRDTQAAQKFFRTLLTGFTYVPRVIITEKLTSSGAAKREIVPGVEHHQHRSLNNRAENSHLPVRLRERKMQGFKSLESAQQFLTSHTGVYNTFSIQRHQLSWRAMRLLRGGRF